MVHYALMFFVVTVYLYPHHVCAVFCTIDIRKTALTRAFPATRRVFIIERYDVKTEQSI